MLSGPVLKQFRTSLKSQVGNGWSVEGRKSRERNFRKGIIWNLKGDEEDFSFTLENVVEGELLPSINQELSFLILNLLHTKNEFKTIKEITSETSFNEVHTRRICVKLFLENEISRDKDVSKGGRPPWKYGPKTFPTYGM